MPRNENSEKNQPESMLKTVGVLGVITFITVFILALANSLAVPVIEKRLQAEKEASVINLFGEGIFSEELLGFEDIYSNYSSPVTEVLAVKKDGGNTGQRSELSGYCVTVTPKGFSGKITMLVAVNPDGTVKDTAILSMSETAGSGTKIASEEWFQKQFKNKSIEYLPDANSIDIIAHATVSSKAFFNGVTSALEVVKEIKEIMAGNPGNYNQNQNNQNNQNNRSNQNSESNESNETSEDTDTGSDTDSDDLGSE